MTFTPATAGDVTAILSIFTTVYEWFMDKLGNLLAFMTSNPYLMISLAIITLGALLYFFKSIVRI